LSRKKRVNGERCGFITVFFKVPPLKTVKEALTAFDGDFSVYFLYQ